MIYYISGPMRGKANHNRETFDAVEVALRLSIGLPSDPLKNGEVLEPHTVINPNRNFGGRVDLQVTEYMALDLKQVLEADVIVLLPGWQKSEGAVREVQLGVWTGKRFMAAVSMNDGDHWDFRKIDAPEFSESPRGSALDEAKQLITGDRNNTYGPPHQDFRRSADAMTAYGYRHTQLAASAPPCPACGAKPMRSHDIAIAVDCVKTSRLMWTPTKRDSWVDKAGYAGCGFEAALLDEQERLAGFEMPADLVKESPLAKPPAQEEPTEASQSPILPVGFRSANECGT